MVWVEIEILLWIFQQYSALLQNKQIRLSAKEGFVDWVKIHLTGTEKQNGVPRTKTGGLVLFFVYLTAFSDATFT
jgi:hypothetical protein